MSGAGDSVNCLMRIDPLDGGFVDCMSCFAHHLKQDDCVEKWAGVADRF